jgi:hypothetical protein
LDSGDLAYLSIETRKFFRAIEKEFGVVGFEKTRITASNDLNEETIDALNKQVIRIVPSKMVDIVACRNLSCRTGLEIMYIVISDMCKFVLMICVIQ